VLAVVQSRLLRLRHEYEAAEECLLELLAGPVQPPWLHVEVVAEAVRLAFARGQVEAGLGLLDRSGEARGRRDRLTAVADLLREDRAGHAPPVEERTEPLADAVETLVIRACQRCAAGAATEAAAELDRALALARPELLRWPFLDAPPQARRLLRTSPRLQVAAAWLNPNAPVPRAAHAGAGERDADAEVETLTQELSERELEVLTHLAEMLSTAEIAATMFISVNTVRTHIRSILRKLAVTRRNQAVRRARQLGIL
jgi:LuxR family maltose regulon positive regulatory protein